MATSSCSTISAGQTVPTDENRLTARLAEVSGKECSILGHNSDPALVRSWNWSNTQARGPSGSSKSRWTSPCSLTRGPSMDMSVPGGSLVSRFPSRRGVTATSHYLEMDWV